jgi:hypothetical protein
MSDHILSAQVDFCYSEIVKLKNLAHILDSLNWDILDTSLSSIPTSKFLPVLYLSQAIHDLLAAAEKKLMNSAGN